MTLSLPPQVVFVFMHLNLGKSLCYVRLKSLNVAKPLSLVDIRDSCRDPKTVYAYIIKIMASGCRPGLDLAVAPCVFSKITNVDSLTLVFSSFYDRKGLLSGFTKMANA